MKDQNMPCGHKWSNYISCDTENGTYMCGKCSPIGMKVAQLLADNERLMEIETAALIVYEVSTKAGIKSDAIECPHGNIPSYPTHAWWCDRCFYRLRNALEVKHVTA